MNENSADQSDIEAVFSLADAKLGRLIEAMVTKVGRLSISPSRSSPFEALVRAIIYQQMSDADAAKIYKSLRQSVEGTLTPEQVLALPDDMLTYSGKLA